MYQQNRYYEVTPKIVRADCTTKITIKPLYEHCKFTEPVYEVSCIALQHEGQGENYHTALQTASVSPENGCISIEFTFASEQEHCIMLKKPNDEYSFMDFRIYSLREDLFQLKAFKGDFHMHSNYSWDGTETPGFVAAHCRKLGLDIMAVTDHHTYAGSVNAREVYKDLDIDLTICGGEEIHPEGTRLHIVNFGGLKSINEMIKIDSEKYSREVDVIRENITSVKDEYARNECAVSLWCFDKIREVGGLGFLCHPYWLWKYSDPRNHDMFGYYISEDVISYLIEKPYFDAMEIVSGCYKYYQERLFLQISRYYGETAKGKSIPIVGVSDGHRCENGELYGWYYTIIFAKSNKLNDIQNGIKACMSVAVESIPDESIVQNEQPERNFRIHGPFRLVKYAYFLSREVFPRHDEMCYEEGQQMLSHLEGNPDATDRLSKLKGQTTKYMKKIWA